MRFILPLIIFVAGCSAVNKIAKDNGEIQQQTALIRADVQVGKEAVNRGDKPAAIKSLDSIDGRAKVIQTKNADAQRNLRGVQDIQSPWLGRLKFIGFLIVASLVTFLCWRFDIFVMIGAAWQWVMTKTHGLLGKAMGA